jgi:hypothetical protein
VGALKLPALVEAVNAAAHAQEEEANNGGWVRLRVFDVDVCLFLITPYCLMVHFNLLQAVPPPALCCSRRPS